MFFWTRWIITRRTWRYVISIINYTRTLFSRQVCEDFALARLHDFQWRPWGKRQWNEKKKKKVIINTIIISSCYAIASLTVFFAAPSPRRGESFCTRYDTPAVHVLPTQVHHIPAGYIPLYTYGRQQWSVSPCHEKSNRTITIMTYAVITIIYYEDFYCGS